MALVPQHIDNRTSKLKGQLRLQSIIGRLACRLGGPVRLMVRRFCRGCRRSVTKRFRMNAKLVP